MKSKSPWKCCRDCKRSNEDDKPWCHCPVKDWEMAARRSEETQLKPEAEAGPVVSSL